MLLYEIMNEARSLTSAEKCSLFLLDPSTQELVATVFDSDLPDEKVQVGPPSSILSVFLRVCNL